MNPTLINPSAVGSTPEYRECFKCSYRGEIAQTSCPQCGKKLRTTKNIRIRGGILVAIGLFLILFVAGLGVFIGVLMNNAAQDPSAAKKIADEKMLFIGVYGFFGVLALFGLNGVAMGTWQLILGRRNKVFIWIMFFLLALILIACLATVFVLK